MSRQPPFQGTFRPLPHWYFRLEQIRLQEPLHEPANLDPGLTQEASQEERVFYSLWYYREHRIGQKLLFGISADKQRLLKSGQWGADKPWPPWNWAFKDSWSIGRNESSAGGIPPSMAEIANRGYDPVDVAIVGEAILAGLDLLEGQAHFSHVDPTKFLLKLVESRRFFSGASLLAIGPKRRAWATWQQGEDRMQQVVLTIKDLTHANVGVIDGTWPPWYVDLETSTIGPLDLWEGATGAPYARSARLFYALSDIGPITPEQAIDVALELVSKDSWPVLPLPLIPQELMLPETLPRPVCRIETTFMSQGVGLKASIEFSYPHAAVAKAVFPKYLATFQKRSVRFLGRNTQRESQLLEEAATNGLTSLHKTRAAQGRYLCQVGDGKIEDWLRFSSVGTKVLADLGWEIHGLEFLPQLHDEDVEWRADLTEPKDGWFDFRPSLKIGGVEISIAPVLNGLLKAVRAAGEALNEIQIHHIVQYATNKFVKVPPDVARALLSVYYEIIEGALEKGGSIRMSKLQALQLIDADPARRLEIGGGKKLQDLASALSASNEDACQHLPAAFVEKLKPFQREGINWLHPRARAGLGGLITDRAGSGKTLQGLAHLWAEKRQGAANDPSLVVLPLTVLDNEEWQKQAKQFDVDLKLHVHHGLQRTKDIETFKAVDLVLTTYATVLRDVDLLTKRKWHVVILDEAHHIRNSQTRAASAIFMLRANHMIAMSGTAIQISIMNLWSLMHCVAPNLLRTKTWFQRYFGTPIDKRDDLERKALLGRITAPFILARALPAPSHAPRKPDETHWIDLAPREAGIYEIIRAAGAAELEESVTSGGLPPAFANKLPSLTRLRQLCCDPTLVPMEATANSPAPKREYALELIQEFIDRDEPVLLFSNFERVIDALSEALKTQAVPHGVVTGSVKKRQPVIEDFMTGRTKILMATYGTLAEGVNMQVTHHVVLHDPWWNPSTMTQAIARAVREGQMNEVTVHYLLVRGSIEQAITERNVRLEALPDGVLSPQNAALSQWTLEDLKAMLRPLDDMR